MIRSLVLASGLVLAFVSSIDAQTATGRSVASDSRGPSNAGNIARSGATLSNPGGSRSAGTTPLDLGAQRRDHEIQNSICRGC